jgi:hypothetical protein
VKCESPMQWQFVAVSVLPVIHRSGLLHALGAASRFPWIVRICAPAGYSPRRRRPRWRGWRSSTRRTLCDTERRLTRGRSSWASGRSRQPLGNGFVRVIAAPLLHTPLDGVPWFSPCGVQRYLWRDDAALVPTWDAADAQGRVAWDIKTRTRADEQSCSLSDMGGVLSRSH